MKKSFLFAILFTLLLNGALAQNYTRLWVNNYTDTSASWHTNDMAVDGSGKAYITGYFNKNGDAYYQTHLFLLKINASGKQEWMRYFDNALDSIDAGTAVAVDSLGYVYVTGNRIDTFCNICTVNSKIGDIITMKYDAAGNRIWLNRYHDSLYVLAESSGISVQPNGTLCVIGNESRYNFETTEYSSNMLLQKVNANGKTAWLRKKDKAIGNAVCFDKNNNIVVAGAADPSNLYQTQKPAIYKYSATGIFQYSTVFDEWSKNGRFHFVACDNANNIYANGQTDTIAFYNNPRIVTVKYSAAGTQLWYRKEQNNSTTLPHIYGGFAIDASGNSYLTGYIEITGTNQDWITVKYNNAGARQWVKQFDGPQHFYDVPADLAVDKRGNVFVTGYTYGTRGSYEYATLGYTTNGALIGVDYYKNGPGSNNFSQAISSDNAGNVLVTGITSLSLATLKYGKKPTLTVQTEEKAITSDILIYPNPAKERITIQYTSSFNAQSADCIIADMYGNVLMQKRMPLNKGTGNISFTLQSLHTGIYVIKVKEGAMLTSKSFLKE